MAIETIIPVGEYIHIGILKDEPEKTGALIINNIGLEEPNRGVVKAVGDKVNTDENSTKINVDDKVIFVPGAGVKLTNSDESDILISVKNIIGIIKGE